MGRDEVKKEGESCVCVCVRERERYRESAVRGRSEVRVKEEGSEKNTTTPLFHNSLSSPPANR